MIRPLMVGLACIVPLLQLGRDLPLVWGPPIEVPAQETLPPQALLEKEREVIRAALRGDDKESDGSPAGLACEMTGLAHGIASSLSRILEEPGKENGKKKYDALLKEDKGVQDALSAIEAAVNANRAEYERLKVAYSKKELVTFATPALEMSKPTPSNATKELGAFLGTPSIPEEWSSKIKLLKDAWEKLDAALVNLGAATPGTDRLEILLKLGKDVPGLDAALHKRAGEELDGWLPRELRGKDWEEGTVQFFETGGKSPVQLNGTSDFDVNNVWWVSNKGVRTQFAGLDFLDFIEGGKRANEVDYFEPQKNAGTTHFKVMKLTPKGEAARQYNERRKAAALGGWTLGLVDSLCFKKKTNDGKEQETISHLRISLEKWKQLRRFLDRPAGDLQPLF